MEAIQSFTVEKHEGEYRSWPRQTRLFFDGKETGATVPGYVIEAQYRCPQGYLLIISQDCPFEESNDFLLLSPAFELLDHHGLGAPYGSYLLHAHWPLPDGRLVLHYYRSLCFTIAVKRRWFWRGWKLVLRIVWNPKKDPAMQASIANLEQIDTAASPIGSSEI